MRLYHLPPIPDQTCEEPHIDLHKFFPKEIVAVSSCYGSRAMKKSLHQDIIFACMSKSHMHIL